VFRNDSGGRQVYIKGEMQIFALRQVAKTGEAVGQSASAQVLGEREILKSQTSDLMGSERELAAVRKERRSTGHSHSTQDS